MTSQLSFDDKKKMLFDSLTRAEQTVKGTRLEQIEDSYSDRTRQNQSRDVSRRFQGKESIFKRPEAPIGKCLRPRRVPDHQVYIQKCVHLECLFTEIISNQFLFKYRRIHINGKSIH